MTIDLSGFPKAPRLRGDVFAVRPFADDDVDVVAEAATDPHIPLITSVPVPVPYTDTAGLNFLRDSGIDSVPALGYSLAIVDAHTHVAVGQVGLWLRNHDKGRASIG